MKKGDKVKVVSSYSMDCDGAVGVIIAFNGNYIGVEFKEPHRGTHNLEGICSNNNGRWYTSSKLRLIKEYSLARESVMF